MSLLRYFVGVLYVPTMLVGFIGAAVHMIEKEKNYSALFGLLVTAILVSFLLERWIPYQKDWNKNHGDVMRDFLHFVVNEVSNIVAVLSLPVFVALVPIDGIWPDAWPLWAQLFLAILIADMGITLVHYASHKNATLWRFHAIHHSVKRMYGFNGLMKHPLHQIIEVLGGTFPLILLGVSQEVAALLALSVAVQLLLQHSNVNVKIGPLRYFLALSPVHRFHHVKRAAEGDVNFGLFTTIWDRVLGTAVFDLEKRFSSVDLGIETEPDYPQDYFAQLVKPFRRIDPEIL